MSALPAHVKAAAMLEMLSQPQVGSPTRRTRLMQRHGGSQLGGLLGRLVNTLTTRSFRWAIYWRLLWTALAVSIVLSAGEVFVSDTCSIRLFFKRMHATL